MSPFVTFCQKTIPLAFDESMSYMEALYALRKYIEGMTGAINTNAEALVKLQEYVEHYFDNLDVQEEINNKLDEMAESGQLADIIAGYVELKAKLAYDTVTAMKIADNLVDGSFATTLGYYAKGDGGASDYKVRTITNADVVDEMKIVALANPNLVAELAITPEMNVRQFGAKGDGENDDTTAIQTALDSTLDVYIPAGTYMIDASENIKANDGNRIRLNNEATLKAITNSLERYVIVSILNADNVEISGGTIEGDRATHTGATGEWGACIKIDGDSTNIYIHDILLKDAWGDGITIHTTGDVVTERVHVDNVRRNGYSITCAGSFISNDDFIENTNGTAPQFAVDIEPDLDTEILNNVVFNNFRTKNNIYGGGISQHLVKNNSSLYYIEVNNYISENDLRGVWINSTVSNGKVVYNNPVIKNSKSYGVYLKNLSANLLVKLDKPCVDGYFVGSSSASSGIYFNAGAEETIQNIYINEPIVVNNQSASGNNISIRFNEGTNCTYKNVYVYDPIRLDLGIRFNSLANNVKFSDKYEIMKGGTDGAYTLNTNPVVSIITTDMTTQLRQFWISKTAKFPVGYKVKFLNNGDYGIKLYFEDQYIYGITNEAGKIIQSSDKGAYLEVMRIGDNEWTVLSISGTWTHN